MNKLCDSLMVYATRMQYKLDLSQDKACDIMNPDGKGRTWMNCGIDWLFGRLKQEVNELEVSIFKNDHANALDETADVGNFSMFIHDIVRASLIHFNEPLYPVNQGTIRDHRDPDEVLLSRLSKELNFAHQHLFDLQKDIEKLEENILKKSKERMKRLI